MGKRDVLFLGALTIAAALLASGLRRPPEAVAARTVRTAEPARLELAEAAARIDRALLDDRNGSPRPPVSTAPELARMRRLNLALTGRVPSLEEIRQFEAIPGDRRVSEWLEVLLRDRRTADYLSERLARAFVGTEDGPFLLFRRRRFTTWLSDSLMANRPYDAIVRDLIATSGVWTDRPAVNFLTVTRDEKTERPDPERLATRTSRAFLGARLDCAQCHDHPFQPWTQADFRGLAAFFGAVRSDLRGVRDTENLYRPVDRKTHEPVAVAIEPAVPFLADRLPESGGPRDRLAAWVVDPQNPRLAMAAANRFWALLFGRPIVEPIDDLPAGESPPSSLVALADDFRNHGYDLHRLIRLIASTELFSLESADGETRIGDDDSTDAEDVWGSFPMTPLRPEQVAGSLFQVASLTTINRESPWLVRLTVFNGGNDFVRRYGDLGEDEFGVRTGTIPQRLLLMNGDLVRETTKDDLFHATTRIANQARDDRAAVETAFLTVLTRRPTPEESDHFADRLDGAVGPARVERLADLFWSLLNTTEFSWDH